jgi:hypothetical protein
MKALLAAALTAAAITMAGIAHADPQDAQFLAALTGINLPPDQALTYAHRICDAQNQPRIAFAVGQPTPITLAYQKLESELSQRGLTEGQMIQLKRAAITSYCPELKDWP